MWVVVGLVSVATTGHQGWSGKLFTTVSDMFPRFGVGSVVGIGGAAGGLGGVLVQKAAGYVVTWTHSYLLMFLFCGCAYVIALAIMHLMSPRLAPAELD